MEERSESSAKNANKEQPHILVLVSDDMSWNQPGFNGGTRTSTPHLDGLAEQGVKLTQFYVQSVCSPTRACLMTGRYPFQTGMEERPHGNDTHGMLTDERTMADALKEAGYYTAIIGKWHLGAHYKKHLPMQRGFDYQYGHYGALVNYYKHDRKGIMDWHRNEWPLIEEGYSTFLIADEFKRMLHERDKDKPLFAYVPFNAPHGPFDEPPEKYMQEGKHLLASIVEAMDDAIGQVINAMDAEGMIDNTLVVFLNDNGGVGYWPDKNLPFRGLKGDFYEGGVRVPCVLKWPGKIQAGTAVDEPIHVNDLYPTIINQAGGSLEQPLPVDGKDVWQTILGNEPSPRDTLIHCLESNIRNMPGAIRIGDLKLIGEELYNIKEDPYEQNDISEQFPDTVAKYRGILDELSKKRREIEPVRIVSGQGRKVYGEIENANWSPDEPEITRQPRDFEWKDDSVVYFSLKAVNARRYIWQVDKGNGFVNLTQSNEQYDGVNTDSLVVKKVSADMSGYKFRCLVTTNWITPEIESRFQQVHYNIVPPKFFNDVFSDAVAFEMQDNQAPVIESNHEDIELESNQSCQAYLPDFTDLVTASDNETNSLDLKIEQSPEPYSLVTGQNIDVTLSVTDEAGNTTNASFNVILEDNSKPAITCREDTMISVDADDNGYLVTGTRFDPVSVQDNCGVIDVLNDFNNKSTLEGERIVKDTTILWTATDEAGNKNQCKFSIDIDKSLAVKMMENGGIQLYPNPVQKTLFYKMPHNQPCHLTISDLTGKIYIREVKLSLKGTINVSLLPKGMYIVNIESQNDENLLYLNRLINVI